MGKGRSVAFMLVPVFSFYRFRECKLSRRYAQWPVENPNF